MHPMPEYVIRDFKKPDENQIIELLRLAFDPNMTREYWEWLYLNNPNGHYVVVAEVNGEIAGNDGFIPIRMKIGEKEIMAVFNASLVVNPRHRRKGIFLKMGTYATTQLAKNQKLVCVGFPNKIAYPGHLKYGWFTASSMHILVKFVSGRALMNTQKAQNTLKKYHLQRIQSILLPIFALIFRLDLFQAQLKYRIKRSQRRYNVIVSSTPFPEEIDGLWLKVKDKYEILTVRDKKYLDWRFHECPDRKYIVLVGKSNEELAGYLVAAQENKLGLILDVFGETDSAFFDVLIREATKVLKNRGVEKIIARVSANNDVYQAFLHNGWFKQQSTPVIARVNTLRETRETEEMKAYLCNPSNWYVTASENL